MTRPWLSAAAAAILASPAIAADIPVKAPLLKAPPPIISTWTGCYFGGNAGWFGASQTAETVPLNNDGVFGETTTSHNLGGSGAIGGAYAGCDWQTGQMVIGGEGDLEFLKRNNSNTQFSAETLGAPPGIPNYIVTSSASNNWLGSLRGRVGFTTGQWLLYATGGAAWTRTSHAVLITGIPTAAQGPNSDIASTTLSADKSGLTIGAGVERMLAPNWSVRLEYLYYRFGGSSSAAFAPAVCTGNAPPCSWVGNWSNLSINTVTVGVSYKFGGPVATGY
jgi:outer membrane immunogenic protein